MQDQSAFYTFWLRLIMDPEYMKVCIAQQGMPCSDANKKGVDNRTRKAQLSVCCRYSSYVDGSTFHLFTSYTS